MASQRIAAELEKMMTSISTARLPKGFTETIANVDGVKINYKIGGRGPVAADLLGAGQIQGLANRNAKEQRLANGGLGRGKSAGGVKRTAGVCQRHGLMG